MLDTGFTARLVMARSFGFRPLYLHTVKPSHLKLAVQSVCVCECVWSVGLWHTAAQLRRGETHTTRSVFEILEPFICRPQDSANYAQDLSFGLWSGFAADVFLSTAPMLQSG